MPNKKNSRTANVVPLPLPNNDPINMNKNIIVEETILKCNPKIEPMIKKIIINNVFPKPIPKCEPTNAI